MTLEYIGEQHYTSKSKVMKLFGSCENCGRNVELNNQGNCSVCGSSSTIELSPTTVINISGKRRTELEKIPGYVYIGRPSIWGNPFKVGRATDSRAEVIQYYKNYLYRTRPDLVEKAERELKGKILGCFCKPKQCHGDILAAIANGEEI